MLAAIDPGLRMSNGGTGVVTIAMDGQSLVGYVVQSPTSDEHYALRAHQLALAVASTLHPDTNEICMEMPAVRQDNTGRAAMDSEAIQKLYMYTGMLVGILAYAFPHARLHMFTPQAWKGATPKAISHMRILSVYSVNGGTGCASDRGDVLDALGIYMAWKAGCTPTATLPMALFSRREIPAKMKAFDIVPAPERHISSPIAKDRGANSANHPWGFYE